METDGPYSLEPVVLLNEVFPGHTNALNTLYGGRLMSIMDTAAGMSASKFAHREFVTVSVDALKFRRPAFQGDVIRTTARVVWTSPRTAASFAIMAPSVALTGLQTPVVRDLTAFACVLADLRAPHRLH